MMDLINFDYSNGDLDYGRFGGSGGNNKWMRYMADVQYWNQSILSSTLKKDGEDDDNDTNHTNGGNAAKGNL